MDIELIERVTEHYKQGASVPDAARLDFFEQLYRLQAEIEGELGDGGYEVPEPAQLREWYWGGKPVFGKAPVAIGVEAFAGALARVAEHVGEHAGLEDAAAKALLDYDWRAFAGTCDLGLAGSDATAFLEGVAEGSQGEVPGDVPAGTFALVVAMAMRPFLEGPAKAVMEAAGIEGGRQTHGSPRVCPVCGSQATASFVGQSAGTAGQGRMQYCGRCGTAWPYERVRCGVCGSQHAGHLHYFNLEGDDAHRIQMCDDCGQYERVVFQESLEVPVCMEVEDVRMAKLDQVALDPRFQNTRK